MIKKKCVKAFQYVSGLFDLLKTYYLTCIMKAKRHEQCNTKYKLQTFGLTPNLQSCSINHPRKKRTKRTFLNVQSNVEIMQIVIISLQLIILDWTSVLENGFHNIISSGHRTTSINMYVYPFGKNYHQEIFFTKIKLNFEVLFCLVWRILTRVCFFLHSYKIT